MLIILIYDVLRAEGCSIVCQAWGKRCPGSSPNFDPTSPLLLPVTECSSHGTCQRSTSNCREGDPSCTAVCLCDAGFRGSACAFTDASFADVQALRSSLLTATMSAFDLSEPTAAVIAQQAAALDGMIGGAPDQLDDAGKAAAVAHCQSLISHLSPDSDPAVLNKLLGTVSAISKQATSDASTASQSQQRMLAVRGAVPAAIEHQRRLVHAAASTAESLFESTVEAIHAIVAAVLQGTLPGETPKSLSVGHCTCIFVFRAFIVFLLCVAERFRRSNDRPAFG